MRRSERLHALGELLRRHGAQGCSAERIAEEFEVSVRTVKRDIAALEATGTPIWSRPGPHGGYGIARTATLPPITLTPAQAVSLLTAVAAAPTAPYADLARAATQKILDVLDPRTRAEAEALAQRVWVDSPAPPPRAVRSALEQAMTDQVVVRIRYADAAGSPTQRDVEPILFAARHGTWYLIAWCQLREAVRWFSVERIRTAKVTTRACTGHTVAEVGEPPTSARAVHRRAT